MPKKLAKNQTAKLLKSFGRVLKLHKIDAPVFLDLGHASSGRLKWVCRIVNEKQRCSWEVVED